MTRCRVCRRPLTSPDSQAAGVGPTCAKAGVNVTMTRVKTRPDGRQVELFTEVDDEKDDTGLDLRPVEMVGIHLAEVHQTGVSTGNQVAVLGHSSEKRADDSLPSDVIDFDALRRRVTP